jgi:hypothetical protein
VFVAEDPAAHAAPQSEAAPQVTTPRRHFVSLNCRFRPHIEVNFKEMKLEVQFPPTVDGEKTAVRALYVKYDHLSDLSDTYQKPDVPEQYDIGINSLFFNKRTTTPQFTPKIELITLYTFDRG